MRCLFCIFVNGKRPCTEKELLFVQECDICCEKFEQFWEETNEEWHYKSAVRIDGKASITQPVLPLQAQSVCTVN